jgi:hypothetical protein
MIGLSDSPTRKLTQADWNPSCTEVIQSVVTRLQVQKADQGKPRKKLAACASSGIQKDKRPTISIIVRGQRLGGGSGERESREGKRAVGGLKGRKLELSTMTDSNRRM